MTNSNKFNINLHRFTITGSVIKTVPASQTGNQVTRTSKNPSTHTSTSKNPSTTSTSKSLYMSLYILCIQGVE